MSFLQEFFEQNSSVLSERLKAEGFTEEQAGEFLPEASSAILKAFQHKELEKIIAAMGLNKPEALLEAVNVNAIAENIGMSAYQVSTGFEVIAPVMAEAFSNNNGGVVSAAASIAWGDFLNFSK